jgi:DNA-binding NarL/FixJ family response regulator
MGGKETVKHLVDIDPEVKAIVSSGYSNDPIMADYTSFGFSSAVSKPYDIEKLGEALRVLFG